MLKVTKKAFIDAMTNNEIVPFGMMKRLAANDELALAIDNYKEAIDGGEIVCHVRYTAHAKFLEATGGSRLYFDQKDTEYSFYEFSHMGSTVFACREYNRTYENEKVLFYLVA